MTKTETYEDEDRLTLGTSEVAAPVQLTLPQSDDDGTQFFLLSCDPLTPEPMNDAAVSAAAGPVEEPL